MRRMAKRVDADLVYLNGPRLLPAAAMAGFGAPRVVSLPQLPGLPERCAVWRRFALRRMDAWLVGQCEFVAAPWRPFVRPERVSVIYNGVAGPARAPRRVRPPGRRASGASAASRRKRDSANSSPPRHASTRRFPNAAS